MAKATFGGGCFWCTETIFKRLKGVKSVMPGYSGGNPREADYYSVAEGDTEHVESVQIEFDPKQVSYEKLLAVFFSTHDPTQVGGQGHDKGDEYQSTVFYHDEEQKKVVERAIKELDASGSYEQKIATKVRSYEAFFEAEGYHHNFYEKNKGNAYCNLVIEPKLDKLEKLFKGDLKAE